MKRGLAMVLLMFLVAQNGFAIMPVIDVKRIASMVAKWVGVDEFWDNYNKYFEGGDCIGGWLKVDDLIDKNLDWSYFGLFWTETQKLFKDELKEGLEILINEALWKIDEEGIIVEVFSKLQNLEDEYWIGENKIDYGPVRQHNKVYREHVDKLEKLNEEVTESFIKYLTVLKDTKEFDKKLSKKADQYFKDIENTSSLAHVVRENKLFSIIALIDYDTMALKEELITLIRTRMENEALLETIRIKTGQLKKEHRAKSVEAVKNVYQ